MNKKKTMLDIMKEQLATEIGFDSDSNTYHSLLLKFKEGKIIQFAHYNSASDYNNLYLENWTLEDVYEYIYRYGDMDSVGEKLSEVMSFLSNNDNEGTYNDYCLFFDNDMDKILDIICDNDTLLTILVLFSYLNNEEKGTMNYNISNAIADEFIKHKKQQQEQLEFPEPIVMRDIDDWYNSDSEEEQDEEDVELIKEEESNVSEDFFDDKPYTIWDGTYWEKVTMDNVGEIKRGDIIVKQFTSCDKPIKYEYHNQLLNRFYFDGYVLDENSGERLFNYDYIHTLEGAFKEVKGMLEVKLNDKDEDEEPKVTEQFKPFTSNTYIVDKNEEKEVNIAEKVDFSKVHFAYEDEVYTEDEFVKNKKIISHNIYKKFESCKYAVGEDGTVYQRLVNGVKYPGVNVVMAVNAFAKNTGDTRRIVGESGIPNTLMGNDLYMKVLEEGTRLIVLKRPHDSSKVHFKGGIYIEKAQK